MRQFHLLNKTLRSIFKKLTHRACNSPWVFSGKVLWRKVTSLGLCKTNTEKRSVAYSPVRIKKRSERFYGEVDLRLRKGGL